jgi:hypothetical protein
MKLIQEIAGYIIALALLGMIFFGVKYLKGVAGECRTAHGFYFAGRCL